MREEQNSFGNPDKDRRRKKIQRDQAVKKGYGRKPRKRGGRKRD